MYYYVYVDANSQVTWVGAMPSPLPAEGYIEITQEQYENGNLMGKYWNGSEFVDALIRYYAILNEEDIVIDVIQYEGTLEDDTVVEISSLDTSLVGLWYDRDGDQTFKPIPIHVASLHNTNEISYKNEDKWLSTKLDEMDAAIAQAAQSGGTTVTNEQILTAVKEGDGANSGLDADLLDGKHASEFASADHTHTGYAESDHTHAGYAPTNHTHTGYASSTHSHSEYAATGHTHSGYATTGHSHSTYLPKAGGTIDGDLEINGELDVWNETNFRSAVRTLGTQTLYNSGTQIMFGSNNLASRICGSAISATKTIAVDSDERLKENIKNVDGKAMIEFIKALDIKRYNYIGSKDECIGVIAQQLPKINPEIAKLFVSEGEDGYLTVKVSDLVFPLILAIQELLKK